MISFPRRDPPALKPVEFQILLVLSDGTCHGYQIMKKAEAQARGRLRLEVGSLYRVLTRLLDQGLIEDTRRAPPSLDSRRRRFYQITPRGRRIAAAEARRLEDLVDMARARDLLPRRS